MPLMHWSPNLSVGIGFMDADHQALMVHINELHELASGDSAPAMLDKLDELIAATEAHFAREEAAMQDTDYSCEGLHRDLHAALVEELHELRDRTANEGMRLGTELTRFLSDWLLSHILESDKHLGGFLEGRGVSSSEMPGAA